MDGERIFRIVFTGTWGALGTWRFRRLLELQQGGGTTLTDGATGECAKKMND